MDELVSYLNRIDSGYRSELKNLNEANFARFDDKLERRVAELKAEITAARADVIKWMLVFWGGTLVPLAGLMVVLVRF